MSADPGVCVRVNGDVALRNAGSGRPLNRERSGIRRSERRERPDPGTVDGAGRGHDESRRSAAGRR